MNLADLLKPKQSISGAYAPGGFFNPQSQGGLSNILQGSVNKSSPRFRATQQTGQQTPTPTTPTAPAMPMSQAPQPISDGPNNYTPVDWNSEFAYRAQQGDKSAQDWIDQNTIDDTQGGGYDFGGGDGTDFSTPTSDVAYSMEKLNELYGTKSPEDLWALRQKLRLQESQASAGMLPEEEYMKFQGDGITDGAPRYNYDQKMGVNRATADIFSTQVSDLDKFMSDQSKGTGSSNQMTDNERALMTKFEANSIVKDFNTVISQKNAIDSIIESGAGGPGDVATIFSFMKALDPNSVVRESEYDTAAKSGNLFKGIYTKFNGYFKENGGILPDSVKKSFQDIVNKKLSAQKMQYDNYAKQVKEIAKRQGMNPDNVVIDFGGGYIDSSNTPETGASSWNQNPDGTWSFKQVGGGTNTAIGNTVGKNRPQRNNNPLNIKSSSFTSKFPGVKGIDGKPASDGGHFLVFNSPQDGFNAAVKLFKEGKPYQGKTVDQALRIWSNNGYGGNIVPQYANTLIQSLPNSVLQQIIQKMANAEGYYA